MIYLGPETIVPIASVLAAVGGFILMLWHRIVGFVKSALSLVGRVFGRG